MAKPNSILDARLTGDEIAVLKQTIDDAVVSFQAKKDIEDNMMEQLKEVAEELQLSASDIKSAASTIFKANLASKQKKQCELEELLQLVGVELDTNE